MKKETNNMLPLQPYQASQDLQNAIDGIRAEIRKLKEDRRMLFMIIADEMSHNGGHICSTEADLWMKQRFAKDDLETAIQIVNRNLK